MRHSIDAGSNVKVVCRFRPLIDIELELGGENKEIYSFPTDTTVKASDGESFAFDKVFSMSAKQPEVFDFIGKPIIEDVLIGYNGTVLAYGQTGSGKSYSMMGLDIYDSEGKGIIPRAIRLIFDCVCKVGSEAEFTLKCSMLEIYKEKLKDLCGFPADLKIKESKTKGIYVDGLTEIYVACEEEMLGVLAMGERNRTVASTKMNSVSSRSHQIFILEVKQKLPNDSEKRGILNLVDLAGSEKINQTGVTGNKLEEAKKINLSLSALGNVIKSLTSNAEHIPYRDSKLTRLLQESLGGNYKTTLVVCCSPHSRNVEDTYNTLKFAQRAKTIRNKAHLNIKKSPEAYMKIIEELKLQLRTANEEIEFWKEKVNNWHNRRKTAETVASSMKSLQIPELTNEDPSEDCSSRSSISKSILNEYGDEIIAKLRLENESLQEKINDLNDGLSKESMKRIAIEKNYLEISETYNKLILTINEKSSNQEYLAEENTSLYNQIELYKSHILLMNKKYSDTIHKLKTGEDITEWEFSDNPETSASFSVYTQDNPPPMANEKPESLIGIALNPDQLISQDTYAQEFCSALEESSQLNKDLIIFELKKQILQAGMVNSELFRNFTHLKLKDNLLTEKFNLKVKLVKFQENKLRLYESMMNMLQESYDKMIRHMGKFEIDTNFKELGVDPLKKARIARPIKGNMSDVVAKEFKRGNTILQNDERRPIQRLSTYLNPRDKDIKFKGLESGFQLLTLYNQQVKKELEIMQNERNTYKSLYSSVQIQYLDVYKKEKIRWKKYLDEFKENCNRELKRKQIEINKLNEQIAHWMGMYIELQQHSDYKLVKKNYEKRRNNSSIELLLTEKPTKMQLLLSPLHCRQKLGKLSALNSRAGDRSPPIFED